MNTSYFKEIGLVVTAVVLTLATFLIYDRLSSRRPEASPVAPMNAPATQDVTRQVGEKAPPATVVVAQPPQEDTWDARANAFLQVDANPAWPIQGLALWTNCVDMVKAGSPTPSPSQSDLCDRLAGSGVAFVRSNRDSAAQPVVRAVASELRRAKGLLSPRQLAEMDAGNHRDQATRGRVPASAALQRAS
jgi:hypothetical protein